MASKSSSTSSTPWTPPAAAAKTASPAIPTSTQRSLDYFQQIDRAVRPASRSAASSSATPPAAPALKRSPRHRRTRPRLTPTPDSDSTATPIAASASPTARAAILAGAIQVQGTLLGTGERCGNVNLTTVIGGMQLRGEAEFVPPESLTGLTSLAHSAYAAFGLDTRTARPSSAPAHSAPGPACMAAARRKNPGAYLWCDPARVGANPVIGVNAQSGKRQHRPAL